MTLVFSSSPARVRMEAAPVARQADAEASDRFTEAARSAREHWRTILHEVSAKHGLTIADLIGPGRFVPFCRARQEAMWRMYFETKLSSSAIGKRINRDHATVMYGIQQHQNTIGQVNVRRNPVVHKHPLELIERVCAMKGKKTALAIAHEFGLPSRQAVSGIWSRNKDFGRTANVAQAGEGT